MPRKVLSLDPEHLSRALDAYRRTSSESVRKVLRVVLAYAKTRSERQVAVDLMMSRRSVSKALALFSVRGPALAPSDLTRRGRPGVEAEKRTLVETLGAQTEPKVSLRAIAAQAGLSLGVVSQILRRGKRRSKSPGRRK